MSNSPAVAQMRTVKTVYFCRTVFVCESSKCTTSAFIPSPVEYFHESIVQRFFWLRLWILSMRALCRRRGALWVIGCKNGLVVFCLIKWLIGVLCNVLRPAGRSGNGFQDGLCRARAGNSWPEASERCALVTGVCWRVAKRGWFQSSCVMERIRRTDTWVLNPNTEQTQPLCGAGAKHSPTATLNRE